MVGLFRVFLIIGIIWLVLRIWRRYIMPFVLRKAAGKMQETMQQRMEDMMRQQQGYQEDQTTEGNVNVKKKASPGDKRELNDDAGEFVDFEEVD